MWGQGVYNDNNGKLTGIIPTRVGTSITFVTVFSFTKDHPHACGDKHNICNRFFLYQGSSPRVWGQEKNTGALKRGIRIIPTRVGTSACINISFCTPWDHPHACGDKRYVTLVKVGMLGSSPRVWGQEKRII